MNKIASWVYNPFRQIAGWKAFAIGLIILCVTTVIGYFGNTVFFGISVKLVASVTWFRAFFVQGLGLAVTALVMWIIALLSAKHVRFQDILGTVTLSKYPLVFAAIVFWIFGKRFIELTEKMESFANIQEIKDIISKLSLSDYALFAMMVIVSILILVWTITLLFNAFRVSTNLKEVKCALLFMAALLISEIINNVLYFTL
ncbi:MAG: hypothetical protein LBE91_00995 [Tannerella sp.]|jgi:hypothetical protein|nr:hypothetical protein [Tannerella sp.]